MDFQPGEFLNVKVIILLSSFYDEALMWIISVYTLPLHKQCETSYGSDMLLSYIPTFSHIELLRK